MDPADANKVFQSPDEALPLPKAPFRTCLPVQTVLQHHDEPDLRRFKQATAERLSDRVNAHRVNEMNIGGFQVSEMGYSNERHEFVIQSYNKEHKVGDDLRGREPRFWMSH